MVRGYDISSVGMHVRHSIQRCDNGRTGAHLQCSEEKLKMPLQGEIIPQELHP